MEMQIEANIAFELVLPSTKRNTKIKCVIQVFGL